MTTPSKFGTEIQVNTVGTSATHSRPTVTALANGQFVVSWADFRTIGDDVSGSGIRAQLFNADGSKAGDEFLVNSTTTNSQMEAAITALPNGEFVATWQDHSGSGSRNPGTEIRAQIFNAEGKKIGFEFLVNTTSKSGQWEPEITTLTDGRFAVSWVDTSKTGGDESLYAIRAQVFEADGSKSGTEFLVNTTTDKSQWDSSISALADGRFVVAWEDYSQTGGDTSDNAIRAQVFNADGSKLGAEFLVNTTTFFNQTQPSVTDLVDGRFAISWTDESASGNDQSSTAIRAQVFNSDGSKSGTEFLVNTTTLNQQTESAITGLADGRFVVTWTDYSVNGGDTEGAAIRAQVFNSDGTKSGSEFLVNTEVSGDQLRPTIALLADGRFVISWEDIGGINSSSIGPHIRAQIFDPREEGLDLTGTAGADDFIGTGFNDLMKGLAGKDVLLGEDGHDALWGGSGRDILQGGKGRDNLVGQNGKDLLVGGGGKDKIKGGAGDDALNGGAGKDILIGGGGADRFVFVKSSDTGTSFVNRDLIMDFDQAENDQIVLSRIDAGSASGDQAFTFIGTAGFSGAEGELRYEQGKKNTIIQADIDGDGVEDFAITLSGLHSLETGDFIL